MFISHVCWISEWIFAVAFTSADSPKTITIQLYHAQTLKMIKELQLTGEEPLRLNDMVFDDRYLVCLFHGFIHVFTFSHTCK